MSTPAKKTTPAKATPAKSTGGSLQDFLKKDNDQENKEKAPVADNNEEKFDRDEDVDNDPKNDEFRDNGDDRTENDLIKPESVVEEQERGVDNQVGNNKDDGFRNPDGVSFSGRDNPMNKTPADMAAETPDETQRRYDLPDEIPEDVHNNPNSVLTNDNRDFQIPSGTHLHPDVARDTYMRSVGGPSSEVGRVTVPGTQNVYATEAPVDDKGIGNKQPEGLA